MMKRHVVGFFAGIFFTVMIVAAGFGLCLLPKTTELLATYTDAHMPSPFTAEQLVKIAVAGEDYTMWSNDYDKLMQVIQQANVEADTPYAGLSINDLANAPEQYVLDARAISHLDDCFKVVNIARAILIVIAVLGVAFFIWLCAMGKEGRKSLSWALRMAAIILAILLVTVAILAAIDFNTFFDAFHRLFFASGTGAGMESWEFSANSLLITIYPLEFWVGMGIIWVVTSLVTGLLFFALGNAIKPRKAK